MVRNRNRAALLRDGTCPWSTDNRRRGKVARGRNLVSRGAGVAQESPRKRTAGCFFNTQQPGKRSGAPRTASRGRTALSRNVGHAPKKEMNWPVTGKLTSPWRWRCNIKEIQRGAGCAGQRGGNREHETAQARR